MAISFVGRSQAAPAGNVTVTISIPAGTLAGDFLLAWAVSFTGGGGGVAAVAPSGWTQVGSTQTDGNPDSLGLFSHTYATADGSSYVFTGAAGAALGSPKVIMRTYRGVTSADANNGAATVATAASLQIPALAATAVDSEWYVAAWVDNVTTSALTNPGDLVNATADTTHWSTFEGDKNVGAKGNTPGAETSTGTTGNWTAIAVTLKPQIEGYAGNTVTPPRTDGMQAWLAPVRLMRAPNANFRAANLPSPERQSMPPIPAIQQGMAPWQAPPIKAQWNVVFRAANLADPYRYSMVPIPAWQAGMRQWWAPIALARTTNTDVNPGVLAVDQPTPPLPFQAIQQAWWAPVPALHPTITEFHGATDRDWHPVGFPFQAIGQPWWAPVWALHPTITEFHGATELDFRPTGFPLPAIQQGWQLQYVRIPPYGPNDIGIVAIPVTTTSGFPRAAIQGVSQFAPVAGMSGYLSSVGPVVGADPIVVWRHRAGMQ